MVAEFGPRLLQLARSKIEVKEIEIIPCIFSKFAFFAFRDLKEYEKDLKAIVRLQCKPLKNRPNIDHIVIKLPVKIIQNDLCKVSYHVLKSLLSSGLQFTDNPDFEETFSPDEILLFESASSALPQFVLQNHSDVWKAR